MNIPLLISLSLLLAIIIDISTFHIFISFISGKFKFGLCLNFKKEKILILACPTYLKNRPKILIDDEEDRPSTTLIIKNWIVLTIIVCEQLPEKVEIKKISEPSFSNETSFFFYKKKFFRIDLATLEPKPQEKI
jgi:hypothetical protein